MQTTVARWGNSLGFRIPRHLAEQIRLVEGSHVELSIENEALVVRPARKRFRLEDLLAHERRDMHVEADTGAARGDEAW